MSDMGIMLRPFALFSLVIRDRAVFSTFHMHTPCSTREPSLSPQKPLRCPGALGGVFRIQWRICNQAELTPVAHSSTQGGAFLPDVFSARKRSEVIHGLIVVDASILGPPRHPVHISRRPKPQVQAVTDHNR